MDSDPQAEPLYSVTAQQETVDLAGNGAYLNGIRVSFRTRSGAMGSVFVPSGEYDPERVKRLLTERATAMEAVQLSTGQG